ncbi:MAG: type IV secretory system conjugative DNA transfer family protein [Pseudomonadota bacterium]
MILRHLYKAVVRSGAKHDNARIRRQSLRNKRALEHMHSSGAYDRGGMAGEAELARLNRFSFGEYSLPTLTINGRPIADSSDRHLHVVGLSGAHKTVAIGLPAAAIWGGSLLVIDIGHEYARATARTRKKLLRNNTYFVSPRGRYGFPSSTWNLFQPVMDAAKAGDTERALELTKDIVFIIIPEKAEARKGSNDWVDLGAQEVLIMVIMFLAEAQPEHCSPTSAYLLLARPTAAIFGMIGEDARSKPVLRRLRKLRSEYEAGGKKQVEWKVGRAHEALSLFEPESAYAKVSSKSSFDPAEAKTGKQPVSIYLCLDEDELESAGAFISLFISMALERIAHASGPRRTLVISEETAQTKLINGIVKGIRTYRKRGLKFITISQTRHSISERWGETIRKDIESNAGTIVWFAPSIEVAKELEAKSGTRTVFSHGAKDGDSGHVGKSLNEVSIPNLHASEACFLTKDKAILEIKDVPGLVIADATPWWEIEPLRWLIDPGYRNDEYRYDAPQTEENDCAD